MKKVWVNIYTHPKVDGEFEGKEHPTLEFADAAAEHELGLEPDAKLVRQEERTKAE